jgi:hypothetical protein
MEHPSKPYRIAGKGLRYKEFVKIQEKVSLLVS